MAARVAVLGFTGISILGACAAAAGQGWATEGDVARYGIGVLAPALPMRVAPPARLEAQALPPDPCLDDDEVGLLCATALADPNAGPPEPDPSYALGLEPADFGPGTKVQVVYGIAKPRKRWFASVGSQTGMVYGDRNWTYREADGPSVAVGNLNTAPLAWGSSAFAIGGLQLSSPSPTTTSAGTLEPGEFGYTSSIGRLNNTDMSATSGAVVYGPSVGTGSFRYGVTSDVTLEGQVQSAPSLTARGVGTTYSAGEYGSVQAGVTQSTYDTVGARRYRLGYSVNIIDDLTVGLTTERTQNGFSDLATYQSGGASPYSRNIYSAGLPVSGIGTLSGTYTLGNGLTPADDERRIGLVQSVTLAPSVQFALGADRDIVTGDYDVRANLSMPVDTFMRGRWWSR
ncbi:fimbrial protein [Bordetella genomosp. 13]|uniref:fimbrial protein n=1 Tax=Bordetella genomosp. 13 TaxID=463040 RepID=UPI0021B61E44|nr:fimbrial protein [Bordetella genomosp. 13]